MLLHFTWYYILSQESQERWNHSYITVWLWISWTVAPVLMLKLFGKTTSIPKSVMLRGRNPALHQLVWRWQLSNMHESVMKVLVLLSVCCVCFVLNLVVSPRRSRKWRCQYFLREGHSTDRRPASSRHGNIVPVCMLFKVLWGLLKGQYLILRPPLHLQLHSQTFTNMFLMLGSCVHLLFEK